jgi:hypothetical protein
MCYVINLNDFSIEEFKKFMVYCYKKEFLYNEIYNLYIFSENSEFISGPIPYVLFNFNNDQIIEQLYTKILVKAKERNIDIVIVCILDLKDSINYLNFFLK